MTIEQNALQVEKFLADLRKQIIERPQFKTIYTSEGNINAQIEELETALSTQSQLLEEARREAKLYPSNRAYREDIEVRLRALATTTRRADVLWQEFRKATLDRTETLITQLEQETPAQIEQSTTKAAPPPASDEHAAIAEAKDATKPSRVSQAIAGLNTMKTFLVTANDIKKALDDFSPNLIGHLQSALEQIGQSMQYMQHIHWP